MLKSFGKGMFGCFGVFIGFIILCIIGFTFLGNSSDSNTSKSVGETNPNNSSDNTLSKEYHVGDTVSYKGYEIKVNHVSFSNGNEYETPDTGKQYVIINVTITNNTDQKQSYNPYNFKLNANGNATDVDEIVTDGIATDRLNSGDLDNGASVTGNLVGQADPNAKLKLQYETSFWNNETVDISLN
ncbi:DUF4352 domain-containing protein [Enterococcus faecium]|uniref:DUF4352 domain-containing protein n=1 Tax=Enterococcus faecium TaxID=1352 RepID=UPI0019135954|nr:DUF4352 domain-containing protein [Enterococcus faecium]MBK5028078.1 DUF4352 domain-containing protein [Enterococcus faecium]MBK5038822.1 DUF4352 domain-containing protein [Enterococcus faecium]MBK5043895.1 DUF4352 domain-containing protein [Enterococcus faecium]MBK5068817.1 DUF4352 domain-containing protein [Enterococcus faecium]MBK5132113.1 DUF4352 domain-containing protein [Enterococcus faecium]